VADERKEAATLDREKEQAAKHLHDCPFSIPRHVLPWWVRSSVTTCVCSGIRTSRQIREWLAENGPDESGSSEAES
jgi:hypothetical protein